jgi:hypothetical protein
VSARPTDDARTLLGPEDHPGAVRRPSLDQLEGVEVRDVSGDKVGTVADTYTDAAGVHMRYLAVATGWFGTKRHLVPIEDVRVENDGAGDYIVLPYDRDLLKGGPAFEQENEITHEDESGIYGHYGREGYWDTVRARQTPPAPTPQIAEAEVADAIRRGEDPRGVAVKRWGV